MCLCTRLNNTCPSSVSITPIPASSPGCCYFLSLGVGGPNEKMMQPLFIVIISTRPEESIDIYTYIHIHRQFSYWPILPPSHLSIPFPIITQRYGGRHLIGAYRHVTKGEPKADKAQSLCRRIKICK